MKTTSTKRIEAIIKVTERCNINCSYCYMFNLGNEDHRSHSATMSDETAIATAKFLREGAEQLSAQTVRIIFHGGEPLLLKKRRFRRLCALFLDNLADVANVEFSVQTNAMLVDEEWIDIFEQYRFSVGVSIDGPEGYNDKFRKDHQGRGTYQRVVKGIRLLQAASAKGRIRLPGMLVVIDPHNNGKEIFDHLVNVMGAKYINFLLPMTSHDMQKCGTDEAMSSYLLDVGQAYVEHKEKIVVRIVNQFLRFICGASPLPSGEQMESKANVLVAISSDGHIGPDDELKPLNIFREVETVGDTTLQQFLNSEFLAYLDTVSNTVPDECRECCWQNYCRGGAGTGSLIGRYSRKNHFNNKSVHCEPLRTFYAKLAYDAMGNGLAESLLIQCLDTTLSPYLNAFPETPVAMRKAFPIVAQILGDEMAPNLHAIPG